MSQEIQDSIKSRVFREVKGFIKNLSKELKVSEIVIANDILEFLSEEFA